MYQTCKGMYFTVLGRVLNNMRSKENLSLAERCAWHVRAFRFPLVDLSDGRLCKGSIGAGVNFANSELCD